MPHTTVEDKDRMVQVEAVCAGDAWEMGFAQGQSLRAKIQRALTVMTELEAFRLQKPKWMPFLAFQRLAEFRARRFLSHGLAHALPEAQARLQGLVEGAGIAPAKLYLLNAMEAVLSELSGSTVIPLAAACSTVAVTGTASRTAGPILAHNFDYLPSVQPLYTVRDSRPTGRLRSMEFTAAPLCGAVDGINEAGLSIAYNYAYTIDGKEPGPTISMLISEALSRCRNVSQAIELLTESKRWGGGLLMLGDADGHIASLELSSTKSAVRLPSDNGDRLFHTNRFQSESMTSVELHNSAIYSRKAPQALRERRVHQSADIRDECLRTQLARTKQFDPDRITKLMSDHGAEDEPSADTICMHSDYWHTTACLQLFPRERRLRVSYDTARRATFVDFQL